MNIGIDIGSRSVKIYCKNIIGKSFLKIYSTVQFYSEFGKTVEKIFKIDCEKLKKEIGIQQEVSLTFTTTGYGRNNLNIHGVNIISEIQAHATGAISQTALKDFVLLDMGGQDTKVVSVKNGIVDDFEMNDKCAAGTGRYLENIAAALDISIDEIGKCTEEPIELSSTCAIFGETEVVTKIAEGYSLTTLAAGAALSVARRVAPLINQFNAKSLVVTGGVAKNKAVTYFISQETKMDIIVPPLPQFNGAIGCSVF